MAPSVVAPELVQFVAAPYPAGALAARSGGAVVLRLTIGTDGRVEAAEIAEAADAELGATAQRAALQFVFKPALRAGNPVRSRISYRYVFELPAAPSATVPPAAAPSATVPPAAAPSAAVPLPAAPSASSSDLSASNRQKNTPSPTPSPALVPDTVAPHNAEDVVVTGTRTAEQLQRSTLRTGVVTRAEAERRGALNVAEALSGEPGLQVNPEAYSFAGSPAGVQMQGLDAERVLVLRDGERVVGDSGGIVDLAQFSLSGVQRIEYVLGPTSSLYGAGALGGVINILTGAPRDQGASGEVRLQWRSLPEYSADVNAAYRRGRFWLAPNVGVFTGASLPIVTGQPATIYPERTRLTLGLALGLDRPKSETVLEGRMTESHSEGLASTRVPGLGVYFIELPDDTTRWEAKARQRESFGEDVRLDVAFSGQWFQGRAARDRRNSPLDEHRTREQSLLSAETMLTVLDGPRTWITGVRAELEAFEQSLERISAQNNETRSSVLEEVPHVDLLSAALFGQLGWELGERFTLLPGLRTEVHDSVGLVAAPRLAVAWQTSDDVRLRAGGGRGFRVPSAKEYGFLFDHTALGYRVLGNSELRPESSWGVNADAVWSLTADLRVQVSAFHNWVNDLIDTAFVGQGTAGIDDFSYVNVGRARTFGSDVGLTWLLGRRFRSQVAYSYLFTKNEDQGTPLASRPHHTWLSTFTYEPVKGAALTFRQRTVSRAWVSAGVFSPAFNTSDVLFSRRFNPYLEAHAGVLNLLDIKQEPLQLGDQRSVTGRMFVVGLIGSYEGDQ